MVDVRAVGSGRVGTLEVTKEDLRDLIIQIFYSEEKSRNGRFSFGFKGWHFIVNMGEMGDGGHRE